MFNEGMLAVLEKDTTSDIEEEWALCSLSMLLGADHSKIRPSFIPSQMAGIDFFDSN